MLRYQKELEFYLIASYAIDDRHISVHKEESGGETTYQVSLVKFCNY